MGKWLIIQPWFTPVWIPKFEPSNDVVDVMLARWIGFNSSMGIKQLSGISCRCRRHGCKSKWAGIKIISLGLESVRGL
jgi:hypothetical protein